MYFQTQSTLEKAGFSHRLIFLTCLGSLFTLFGLRVAAQPQPLVVTTLAGLAKNGSADGISSAAKFLYPSSVAVDYAGNVYVADAYNDTIRKVSAAGVVTTVAGRVQTPGTNDGVGNSAQFSQPFGVAVDLSGKVYVADSSNCTIRAITTNGLVTTFAGMGGIAGYRDESSGGAEFNYPCGIAIDSASNIYVADTRNNLIRKIANGNVTTLAGDIINQTPGNANGTNYSARFSGPYALAVDSAGNVYVADSGNGLIRHLAPVGTNWMVTTIATNASPSFYFPTGIAVDRAGNIYVTDHFNQLLRKLTPSGTNWVVSILAGIPYSTGDGDGPYGLPSARFTEPWGVAVDSATNVYVGDSGNGTVRKITPPGVLSTFAGPDGSSGLVNGPGTQARFNQPFGVAVDGATNLYVADYFNNCIRAVTPSGTVTILAGSTNGTMGSADGSNNMEAFNEPSGLCLDAAGNIYVADSFNSTVRKITPFPANSNWVTTTIAGRPGMAGYTNGAGSNALFNSPAAVAVDSATNLYVADTGNNVIRKIDPNGNVSTYAGSLTGGAGYSNGIGSNVLFNTPKGIAVFTTNVYVADSQNSAIRKIAPGGVVTTLPIDGAVNYPEGLAVDGSGNIYIANASADTILEMPPSQPPTVIAGVAGLAGGADGLGAAAHFNQPFGIALDASGNVYVADTVNNTIRKGTPDTPQTAVLTVTSSPAGLAVGVDGTNYPATPQVFAYVTGSTNTVTAPIASNYLFTNWTVNGSAVSSSTNYTFTLDGNETVIANYTPLYTLSVSASPANTGTVNGSGTFVAGSTNTVTATPNGYVFTNWTEGGVVVSTSTNYTVVLNDDVALVANFFFVLTPVQLISLSGNLSFGVVAIGSSAQSILTISNGGSGTLDVSNISYPVGFSGAWSGTIAPGGSQSVTVTFSPTAAADYSGAVAVNSDTIDSIPISGFGANDTLILTILTNGYGTVAVSPKLTGKAVRANTKYTLVATPKPRNVFSNWTGSVTTNKNPLTFKMSSIAVLQANFVTNPFLAVKGTYNGLFTTTNSVTEETAGMLKDLTITDKGTYSGRLLINGAEHAISGAFNLAGQATNKIPRAASQGGLLLLEMTFLSPSNGAPQVIGMVSGTTNEAAWVSTNLTAELATNAIPSGEYTMLIPPDTNATPGLLPGGDGYALITNHAGTAKIAVALADGTAFSQSAPVSQTGDVPIYANLYASKGLLLGWINLDPTNATGGELTWVHPVRSGLFKTAFTSTNSITLAPWTRSSAILTNLLILEMVDGITTQTDEFVVTLSDHFKLDEASDPTSLSGSLNPKTGLLTVTIGRGASKITGSAVLLNGTNGGGFFLTRTNSGAVLPDP